MGYYSELIEEQSEELEFYGQKFSPNFPKISVIIAAFNVETYIYDCLISIIKQTFKDIEIIVINDGSTDNTSSIIKMIMQFDKRIKLIDIENGGVGKARNYGLKLAQGECIIFIDSDDILKKILLKQYIKNTLKTLLI